MISLGSTLESFPTKHAVWATLKTANFISRENISLDIPILVDLVTGSNESDETGTEGGTLAHRLFEKAFASSSHLA